MTTTNIYTHLDDEGMGGAEAFDAIVGAGTAWTTMATGHPQTAANPISQGVVESAS